MADKNLVVKKGIEVSETGSFGGNLSTLGNLTVSGTVSGVTKEMVGLANVDNTTDANKPISTATQTALNAKVTKVTTSTDNALVRFDGTTGAVQNSLVTVDDGGNVLATGTVSGSNITASGNVTGSASTVAWSGITGLPPFTTNPSTIYDNFTLNTGLNASSVGPITIAENVTITLNSNSNWIIQ